MEKKRKIKYTHARTYKPKQIELEDEQMNLKINN